MSTQLGVFLILELTCRPHQPCFIGSMGTSGVVRPYFCAPKYDVCAADLKTPRTSPQNLLRAGKRPIRKERSSCVISPQLPSLRLMAPGWALSTRPQNPAPLPKRKDRPIGRTDWRVGNCKRVGDRCANAQLLRPVYSQALDRPGSSRGPHVQLWRSRPGRSSEGQENNLPGRLGRRLQQAHARGLLRFSGAIPSRALRLPWYHRLGFRRCRRCVRGDVRQS